MKSFLRSIILLLFIFIYGSVKSQVTPVEYSNKISVDSIKNYLYILASDSMEGRETGKLGQKKSAYFLASKYLSWNLKPVSALDTSKNISEPINRNENHQSSFFQDHPVNTRSNTTKNFSVGVETFLFGRDFYYPDNYIDTNILAGKFTFIFVDQKKNKDPLEIYNSKKYAGKNLIIYNVNDSNPDVFLKFNQTNISPSMVLIITTEKNLQQKFVEGHKQELSNHPIQILISEKIANKFFSTDTYQKITGKINTRGKTIIKKSDSLATVELVKNTNQLRGQNVIAFIPGTDRANETVIISSHYDHLGKRDTLIYYGADDNASGTSAVLEIARVFKAAEKEGYGPRRNILFLNVSGEEKRLLGSSWYVSNPPIPLISTIVDLNIDMIGRTDPAHDSAGVQDYVYIIGSDKMSTELHLINEEQNEKVTGLELNYKFNTEDDPNQFYRRSDHYNFVKNGIPVIFYFNGVHADYHKPTDTADKINFEILTQRARLVFLTAWELANRDNRIIVDKSKEKDR